ncbi:diamine N-acetyltransferase [Eubacterium uniforme]|uniref:Diamine N-acetyltransferase n=1 Tax=Eubacterium uniforme TaxID=39495 RepID=A0A1T4V7S6_9FIRM|nr:GNAT family N-acetyltransferase [Eubacterium uniforme]SKA60999.1 diamine N-acetyltransferase [Eubacterium uniforme]
MVTLKKITQDNLEEVLALDIKEEQKKYVSSTAVALAQAYVYFDTAYPFAIYADETVVGLIMMGYYEAKGYYTLWKFLIDSQYQSKGYGRKALELGIKFLKEEYSAKDVYTGVIPGNAVAKSLYESVGFESTGLVEDGMEEMCLEL